MNENDVLKELQNADMKEMLKFVIEMLSAYDTKELLNMKENISSSNDIKADEEITLVIDEILRLRGDLK